MIYMFVTEIHDLQPPPGETPQDLSDRSQQLRASALRAMASIKVLEAWPPWGAGSFGLGDAMNAPCWMILMGGIIFSSDVGV